MTNGSKKINIIVVAAVAILVLCCFGCKKDTNTVTMYKADGSLYINCETESTEGEGTASTGKLNSDSRIIETCAEILKRRSFLTGVAADMGNKYTYQQIHDMISVEAVNDTYLLEITVRGTNPDDVEDILNSILARAPQELVRVTKVGSVEIVDLPCAAEPYEAEID